MLYGKCSTGTGKIVATNFGKGKRVSIDTLWVTRQLDIKASGADETKRRGCRSESDAMPVEFS
jgi:hypothetical protein